MLQTKSSQRQHNTFPTLWLLLHKIRSAIFPTHFIHPIGAVSKLADDEEAK